MNPDSESKEPTVYRPPGRGIWRILPSPQLTEIAARSGFDFQILDREHGAYDFASLHTDIMACELHGCSPWVRVGGCSGAEVQRCLDLGAGGIVFPQLADAAAFRQAASLMDHAPQGVRGYNPFVRAYHYGSGDSALRPLFVPIVETLTAVDDLDEIVKIDRIDLIYIGSYDLTTQLGCPGEIDHPRMRKVVERILGVAQTVGLRVGMMATTRRVEAFWRQRGVETIVEGVETDRLRTAFSSLPTE